jgi:hypothetical protein
MPDCGRTKAALTFVQSWLSRLQEAHYGGNGGTVDVCIKDAAAEAIARKL